MTLSFFFFYRIVRYFLLLAYFSILLFGKIEDKILHRLEKAHNIYFNAKNKPFEVVLLLDSSAIIYFERKPLKGQFLKKNSDGTAELTITATNKEEIFPILKTWLPQIKVIEPPELQEEFEEMIEDYLLD